MFLRRILAIVAVAAAGLCARAAEPPVVESLFERKAPAWARLQPRTDHDCEPIGCERRAPRATVDDFRKRCGTAARRRTPQ